MSRASLWLFILILATVTHSPQELVEGATTQEIASLQVVARELGIPAGTWDFNTDPCVGKWTGIGCCTNNSQSSCCSTPVNYPPSIPCDTSSDAQVWTLILRRDLLDGVILNGSLTDSVCNLSSLRVLDIGFHRISGQVPSCLGTSLTRLEIIRIGDNPLNGTIPEQLGSLRNLRQLYLDSTRITGPIPSLLGDLTQLNQLSLRSNQLQGTIPSEIGNLQSLTSLKLQDNRLTGEIPASFARLVSLTSLELFNNELSGELNSTVFRRMPSLVTLNLRGNRFTGSVPDLSTVSGILFLDLGFNQLSGSLSSSLVSTSSLPRLQQLFLGHNRLNGSIPTDLSSFTALSLLDVSHNRFVGSLVGLGTVSALVDFSFNLFNISTAPPSIVSSAAGNDYFNCPSCSISPSEEFFAVNAGGESMQVVENDVAVRFDADTTNRSVGTFYGGASGSWAVEVSGAQSGVYQLTGSQSLYTSMRWSMSYIAYHSNKLQNGNYIVNLHFIELVFNQPGYRIFDVLVQGETVKENFDIFAEVGFRVPRKLTRNITVTNGTVSIELIYKGRDRYLVNLGLAIEATGPVISGVSVVSINYRGEHNGSSLTGGAIAGVVIGALAVILTVIFLAICLRRSKNRKPVVSQVVSSGTSGSSQVSFEVSRMMTYDELLEATRGFSEKLGEGGFGVVYKGVLPDGTAIAVKQLLKHNQQLEDDFKKEISLLSKVRHRNLLSVIGYYLESDIPMLVCEYIPNGSLDKWLFRRRSDDYYLAWEVRKKIAIGVACGLAYLHDESNCRIIHCDVKPANILLDEDFNPRIADFGLARLYDEKESHVTATRLKGTAGYLAPEYAMHLQLSDKVDVYSFGVVLLELLSGRKAVEMTAPSDQVVLVEWAHANAEIPSNMLEVIDERLHGQYNEEEAKDMTTIAILCTQRSASLRPKMQTVWLMLNGTIRVPEFLENLNAQLQSAGSDASGSCTGNVGETSISQGFHSLQLFRGNFTDSFPTLQAVTY